MLCAHNGSLVVLKLFPKRPELRRSDVDAALAALAAQSAALATPPLRWPHVLPAPRVYNTERAVAALRQHAHASLAERLASRPALSACERLFLAYQLLHALAQVHARGVCHGDLTPHNVLLTSWGWLLLADFATAYKPAALPADNPAPFGFYYDTSASRACHVAPERFVAPPRRAPWTPRLTCSRLALSWERSSLTVAARCSTWPRS